MNISRRHFLMLSAVSLFTGMIAPSVASANIVRPYALTNMQYVAYTVLFWLIFLFILALTNYKKISYMLTGFLIIMVLSLGVMTIAGMVKTFSGEILQGFSWGWIFLLIGLVFLVATFLRDDPDYIKTEKNELSKTYEKIIGITGIVILTLLTIFIIFVAEKNSSKITKNGIVGELFLSGSTSLTDGSIVSPAFSSIKNFSLNRSKNFLTFIGTTADGKTVAYPMDTQIKSPENLYSVHRFADRDFFVQNDGSVIESGIWIGHTNMRDDIADYIVFRSEDGTMHFVSNDLSMTFHSETDTPDDFYFNPTTKDLYWRERIGYNHQVFKNGKAVSDEFPNILRYAIGNDGNIMLIAENQDFVKFVVKNHTTIHTMREDYVQWTLRMNASDVLYVVKNTEDGSFSVVMNGIVLDRKLDEIREIFLEQNSSGFSYFGRPQGESKFCLFTRYRGNLCSIDAYMNPALEGDNSGIVFAARREGKWSIYRNVTEFIKNPGYTNREDISYDYFFFDPTNFRHYIFIEKNANGYSINKSGKILPDVWQDIDVNHISFGYEKIFVPVKQNDIWKILEF